MSVRRYRRVAPLGYPAWIEIAGFKSIREPTRVAIRPITLLAGTNSSGKSSAIQPLLLLKQSLDVPYDPDPLLLDGPHVTFTSLDQFLSRGRAKQSRADEFHLALGPFVRPRRREDDHPLEVKWTFRKAPRGHDRLDVHTFVRRREEDSWIPVDEREPDRLLEVFGEKRRPTSIFLSQVSLSSELIFSYAETDGVARSKIVSLTYPLGWISTILHLPGYRGHRERKYPMTKVTVRAGVVEVAGPAHPYAAALLQDWRRRGLDESSSGRRRGPARSKLQRVAEGLRDLGLTWKVEAAQANAAELELRVGRMPVSQRGGARDLVDIADVGFGVSQVLPVLVTLAAAAPGQMVFIEQPELHLHPKAQLVMGKLLADTAKRGVIVVVETHSQLILRAVQTAVAKGIVRPENVALHWFCRDEETGWTTVTQADVKKDGSFGDWPVDFPDVYAMADTEFVDAVFQAGGPA